MAGKSAITAPAVAAYTRPLWSPALMDGKSVRAELVAAAARAAAMEPGPDGREEGVPDTVPVTLFSPPLWSPALMDGKSAE